MILSRYAIILSINLYCIQFYIYTENLICHSIYVCVCYMSIDAGQNICKRDSCVVRRRIFRTKSFVSCHCG